MICPKKYLPYMYIPLFVVLFSNLNIYLDNEDMLKSILVRANVYDLPDDYEKVTAVNNIVYSLVGKPIIKTNNHIFFCRTPSKILARGGACGDKTFLMVSLLRVLDIESHPLGTYDNVSNDDFKHVMVEAWINDTWFITDPTYNITDISKADLNYTSTFRYGKFGFLRSLDLIQPYVMLRCELRNSIILLIMIFLLSFSICFLHPVPP